MAEPSEVVQDEEVKGPIRPVDVSVVLLLYFGFKSFSSSSVKRSLEFKDY